MDTLERQWVIDRIDKMLLVIKSSHDLNTYDVWSLEEIVLKLDYELSHLKQGLLV